MGLDIMMFKVEESKCKHLGIIDFHQVTFSIACDLDDVLLATVGSLVLFVLPILSMLRTTSVEEAEMSRRLLTVMEPLASSLSSREPLSGHSRSRTHSLYICRKKLVVLGDAGL